MMKYSNSSLRNKGLFLVTHNFVFISFAFDKEVLAYLNANCANDYTNESLSLEEKVNNLIKQNPKITIQEIADSVNKSKRTINNIINSLKEKGMLERIGKTKGYWKII